jgi:pilus assembly protein CpaE
VLLGLGLECAATDCVPYAELPLRLAQGSADLVLVRVGNRAAPAQDAIRQALPLTKGPVLAVGPTSNPHHILETLHCGAREYLDEDKLQATLETALNKLRAAGLVQHGNGRVVGVASATPGSGVTTLATNLAFLWGEEHRDRVALIELGREAASLALNLDLDPRFTVADVAANWQRLDVAFLRQSMTPHAGGVQVLAYKPETLGVQPIEPAAVRKALILLRAAYRCSVLDLGHTFADEHFEAMRLCDVVAIVVRLDVPSLRQARKLLRLCADKGVPRDRIRLVANRYGQRGQIPWRKAEEAIGAPFVEYLPEDSGKLNAALNHGLPLVRYNRGGSLARRLAKLAQLLNRQG